MFYRIKLNNNDLAVKNDGKEEANQNKNTEKEQETQPAITRAFT
eukprot:CAMPEP_0168340228 /NCGR_PEP_ID=MMETSP0213-20121227/13940_1 /TAXON_ID=151035 /ORGANISM="Euplotes harpa, Strain FSP1.4" /LENGTH=43 /DNA_ID= /DNA_START= /DNA_END= /DNA_ORIENTATION=